MKIDRGCLAPRTPPRLNLSGFIHLFTPGKVWIIKPSIGALFVDPKGGFMFFIYKCSCCNFEIASKDALDGLICFKCKTGVLRNILGSPGFKPGTVFGRAVYCVLGGSG